MRMLIGAGSGRCGTHSLAKLLSVQPDTYCYHEARPILDWKPPTSCRFILSRFHRLKRRNKGKKYVGDVALFYCRYLDYILASVDDVRVIVLKRPKDETIASFKRWLPVVAKNNGGRFNLFQKPIGPDDWARAFPNWEDMTIDEALSSYYDVYYNIVEPLLSMYPTKIKLWPTDALNSSHEVREILTFAGYEHHQQVIIHPHLCRTE
jgi:hypothetical protein